MSFPVRAPGGGGTTGAAAAIAAAPSGLVGAVTTIVVVALLLAGGKRAMRGLPDFQYFYKGGAALLENGAFDPGYDLIKGVPVYPGKLDWYLPTVPRMMTTVAWLPVSAAGIVWLLANATAFVGVVWLAGWLLSGHAATVSPAARLIPLLVLLPYWLWEFRLNQVNGFTLLLLLGAYATWRAGYRGPAGLWLGLAVLLKLTPALMLGWFVLKRELRVVLVSAATIALAGPLADVVAFGPQMAAEAYRRWWSAVLAHGSATGIITHQLEVDWRNQSLAAVTNRWLHAANISTRFDNAPQLQARYAGMPVRTINFVDLPPAAVAAIVLGVSGASLVYLAWISRHPAARMSGESLAVEYALWILAMLWLTPVMRRYHMIWTLPAVTLLVGGIHRAQWRGPFAWFSMASIAVVALATITHVNTPLSPGDWSLLTTIEAGGVHLLAVIALAIAMRAYRVRLAQSARPVPAPSAAGAARGDERRGAVARPPPAAESPIHG